MPAFHSTTRTSASARRLFRRLRLFAAFVLTFALLPASNAIALTKSASPIAVAAGGTASYTLTLSDGGATTTPGSVFAYTLNYQNTGGTDLTGLTLTETVPANTTFRSAGSSAGWSCANGSPAGTSCTLAIGTLAAGASGTKTFVVRVVSPVSAGTTQLVNSASIGDGTTSATAVDTTPVNTTPGLAISKNDGGTTTVPGGSVVYTLSYQNTGNIDLSGVVVNEVVPGNTTFRSAGSSAGWSCADGAPAGTACMLALGTLAGGASGARTFAVDVISPVPAGTTQLVSGVTISNGTTSASNLDMTPLITHPSITLAKSDGGASTAPGGIVVYTLGYTNTGDVGLTGVEIAEVVPANTAFDADDSTAGWSCAGGDPAGTTCTLPIGGLAGGQTGTSIFAVKVDDSVPAGTTQIANSAAIAASDGATASADDSTPLMTSPALDLSNSDGGAGTTPGGTIVYALVYTNTGDVGLTGVVLHETVPPNTTFNPATSAAGWSCSGASAGSTCTLAIGGLAGSVTGSTLFAVTVATTLPAGTTQIANGATIDATGGTTASASDFTPVATAPSLSLSKSDNGATAVPGGTVIYTLSYANTGNVGLAGVTLHETVPAHATFNAAGSSAGWSCADGSPAGTSCTRAIGTLAAGASDTADFAVTVDALLPAGTTQIANSATIDATGGTSASGGDFTPVTTASGLSLSKSDGGVTVAPGGVVAYTLGYRNTGNVGLSSLAIEETVPANTTFDAGASSVGWSCSGASAGSTCTLAIGTLAGGASGSATFAVKVDKPLPAGATEIANSATISNGLASATNDDTTPVITTPGLSLRKSDGGASAAPGGVVVYTLFYTNTGDVGLTGVVLHETVPANTTFSSGASAPSWSCANGAIAGTICTLAIGTLAAGASGTKTFAVKVVSPFPAGTSQIANNATISAGGTTGSAGDTTIVATSPALGLAKSDGGASAAPGGVAVYALDYRNAGDVDLGAVKIVEAVPTNTTFDAANSTPGWSCANGAPAGTTCVYTVGTLAGGAAGSVDFAVAVVDSLPAGADQIANTATIADDNTAASATDSDATPVVAAPDLTLLKSDGGASATPGGAVIYTLGYTNTGSQGATGVVIRETVPAHTTFNAAASSAGWSCADRATAGTSCTFTVGSLAAGAGGKASFAVTVDNPLPAGVSQIANTATIADDGGNGADPIPGDNTGGDGTPVRAAPILSAQKSVVNLGGGTAMSGDLLQYRIAIRNTGDVVATETTFADEIPANTSYVAGSTTLNGAPVADIGGTMPYVDGGPVNTPGEPSGQVAVGGIAAIVFRVRIDAPLPAGVTQVSNQGLVEAAGTPTVPTDDPITPMPNDPTVTVVNHPTALTLVSFTATPSGGGILLRWTTGSELNTWAFHLLRSGDGAREHAARVTDAPILGQGRALGGASYAWTDASARAGADYSYWLVEIEMGGAVNEYGPATVDAQPAATYSLLIPALRR